VGPRVRLDRLALGLDLAMLAALWTALWRSSLAFAIAGLLLLFVLLALPFASAGGRAGPRILAAAGFLLLLLVFLLAAVAVKATGPRIELSQGPIPFVALLAASIGTSGLVWVVLWRAIALREVGWKPPLFGLFLSLFIALPALAVLYVRTDDLYGSPWLRVALALAATALGAAAALPFLDTVFRTGAAEPPGPAETVWKRL
jgi:hypothetical protein